MTGTTDPAAALQSIRDRAGAVAKLGPPRPEGDLINAAHRSAGDVPRLVAAVERILELADGWDAGGAGRPGLDRRFIARELREAITRELTGQEDGSA